MAGQTKQVLPPLADDRPGADVCLAVSGSGKRRNDGLDPVGRQSFFSRRHGEL